MPSSLIVEGILRQMGLTKNPLFPNTYISNTGVSLRITPLFEELLDKVYAAGHRDGWERGAYEELTKEDV